MQQLQLKKGDVFIQENSDSDLMYFVMEGEVEIFMMLNGERISLAKASKGDEFGELGLLLASRRTASAVALSDCKLIALDQSEVIQKIKKEPDFAVKMTKKLAGKLSKANDVIKEQISLRKSLEITYQKLREEQDALSS